MRGGARMTHRGSGEGRRVCGVHSHFVGASVSSWGEEQQDGLSCIPGCKSALQVVW